MAKRVQMSKEKFDKISTALSKINQAWIDRGEMVDCHKRDTELHRQAMILAKEGNKKVESTVLNMTTYHDMYQILISELNTQVKKMLNSVVIQIG